MRSLRTGSYKDNNVVPCTVNLLDPNGEMILSLNGNTLVIRSFLYYNLPIMTLLRF